MTTIYLLDSSVLIPLVTAEHVHHERTIAWAAKTKRVAICPVVEGALVRFAVRLGARAGEVQQALRLMQTRPGFEFWPDSVSYTDVALDQVRGHDQVIDAYLAGLATANGGLLATLDQGLAQLHPASTLLVPG